MFAYKKLFPKKEHNILFPLTSHQEVTWKMVLQLIPLQKVFKFRQVSKQLKGIVDQQIRVQSSFLFKKFCDDVWRTSNLDILDPSLKTTRASMLAKLCPIFMKVNAVERMSNFESDWKNKSSNFEHLRYKKYEEVKNVIKNYIELTGYRHINATTGNAKYATMDVTIDDAVFELNILHVRGNSFHEIEYDMTSSTVEIWDDDKKIIAYFKTDFANDIIEQSYEADVFKSMSDAWFKGSWSPYEVLLLLCFISGYTEGTTYESPYVSEVESESEDTKPPTPQEKILDLKVMNTDFITWKEVLEKMEETSIDEFQWICRAWIPFANRKLHSIIARHLLIENLEQSRNNLPECQKLLPYINFYICENYEINSSDHHSEYYYYLFFKISLPDSRKPLIFYVDKSFLSVASSSTSSGKVSILVKDKKLANSLGLKAAEETPFATSTHLTDFESENSKLIKKIIKILGMKWNVDQFMEFINCIVDSLPEESVVVKSNDSMQYKSLFILNDEESDSDSDF